MKKVLGSSPTKALRFVFGKFRTVFGLLQFKLLRSITQLLKPHISLTYDNSVKPDGVGAQVQRILALRSLASNLGFGYFHTGVESVAVHPLDPYQSDADLKEFLTELNFAFQMESDLPYDMDALVRITTRTLGFAYLFRIVLKSVITGKHFLIVCLEPYAISDYDPNGYIEIRKYLPNFKPLKESDFTIGIHYRRGVGGMAVQRGEKLSRELSAHYFVSLTNQIINSEFKNSPSLTIYTDAPSTDLKYLPPVNQVDLWENSPRFEDGVMDILGIDPSKDFEGLKVLPRIVQGGNPLLAIRELAGLDVLIMSRSSFSYLGGILNENGRIYFPMSFWHRPMKSWIKVNEAKYE